MEKFSIVIPALNEQKSLQTFLPELSSYLNDTVFDYEIILIIGEKECISPEYKNQINNLKIFNRSRIDFSTALIEGIREAKYENIITMDSDGSHQANQVVPFLNIYIQKNLDLLIFSRHMESSKNYENFVNASLSKILNNFLKIISPIKLSDYTNNLRVFKKSKILNSTYQSTHFEILFEIILKLSTNNQNINLVEVPTIHNKRLLGSSHKNHFFYAYLYFKLLIKYWMNHGYNFKK